MCCILLLFTIKQPPVDTCGIKQSDGSWTCSNELPLNGSATIMGYCHLCPGGVSELLYPLICCYNVLFGQDASLNLTIWIYYGWLHCCITPALECSLFIWRTMGRGRQAWHQQLEKQQLSWCSLFWAETCAKDNVGACFFKRHVCGHRIWCSYFRLHSRWRLLRWQQLHRWYVQCWAMQQHSKKWLLWELHMWGRWTRFLQWLWTVHSFSSCMRGDMLDPPRADVRHLDHE